MSPRDASLKATLFARVARARGEPVELTLGEFRRMIEETAAPEKSALPLVSFTRFAGHRRSTANARTFSAVCLDHDAGSMSLEDAADALASAGVAALLYSTPSHKPSAPRWRAVLPMSADIPVAEHARMVARANGVLGGAAAPESFAVAQAYFFGRVEGGQSPCVLST